MEVFIIQKLIIKELNEIKSLIQDNIDQYDIEQVNDLLMKLKEDIKLCVKIDDSILEFFNKRANFRVIADLKDFSTSKLKHQLKATKRADIEQELAKVSALKNLDEEKLTKTLGKIVQPVKAKAKPPQKKRAPQAKKVVIQDQTSRWLALTKEQLIKELNDLKTYPDVKTMKQAASSILKANEKKFRNRDKIINTIVERISEEKAIAYLGR